MKMRRSREAPPSRYIFSAVEKEMRGLRPKFKLTRSFDILVFSKPLAALHPPPAMNHAPNYALMAYLRMGK